MIISSLIRNFLGTACLLAGIATASSGRAETLMKRAPSLNARPQIVGGTVVSGADWPSTLPFPVLGGNCTSTIIGDRVVLTAAHCVDDGASWRVELEGVTYPLSCQRNPKFDFKRLANDIALCIAGKVLATKEPYERVSVDSNAVQIGQKLFLVGYGCTAVGRPPSEGVLYGGFSPVVSLATPDQPHILTSRSGDGVMLCPGDSGGAAYALTRAGEQNGGRAVVGVNSGYVPDRGLSYIAPLSSADNLEFLRQWSHANSVALCGIGPDAKKCR